MGKLLLLAIVVWLIIVILKRYRSSLKPTSKSSTSEDIVKCATCGLHLPKSDSLYRDNDYYCCAAHLAQRSHEP